MSSGTNRRAAAQPVRMFLSSFRVGDLPDRLLALMRRQGPAVVIANSFDTVVDDDVVELL